MFYFPLVNLLEALWLVLNVPKDVALVWKLMDDYSKYLCIVSIILSALVFITIWLKKYKNIIGFELDRSLMLALGLIETVMLYFYLQVATIESEVYFLSSILLCLLLVLLITFFNIGVNYYRKLREQKTILEIQSDVIRKEMSLLEITAAQKSQMLHDYKHYFLALKHMAVLEDYERMVNCLDQLIDECLGAEVMKYTDNTLIDLILAQKMACAENLEVKVIYDCHLVECNIPVEDICVLLCNLLDNAIEAAAKTELDRRYLRLSIKNMGELLLIELSNSSNELPTVRNNRFITSKPDTDIHGFGIESVRQIVRKYNGTENFQYDKMSFNVQFVLNNKKQEDIDNG